MEIWSFWGWFSLKWGVTGQFTKLPDTKMPLTNFFNGNVYSGQTKGNNRHLILNLGPKKARIKATCFFLNK
jgi:hypothetical protein